MLQNYLKIAWRNLVKQKGYTAINIAGLAVGIACCILLFMYVRSELAVNDVFEDLDRIYRVDSNWADPSAGLPFATLAAVSPTLKQEYREVIDQVRMYLITSVVRTGQKSFRRDIMVADPSFLQMFDFPLLKGNPRSALAEPRSAVITEELARVLFGTTDVLGRTIMLETWYRGNQPFTIRGVRENLPYNSVTYFGSDSGYDVIIPPEPFGDFFPESGWTSWESRYLLHYVKLAPGVSFSGFQEKLDGFMEIHAPDTLHGELSITLNPLNTLHLTDFENEGWQTIRLLSLIALLVLLIACVNYMNLATACSLLRTQEIGVRKVLGARRPELIRQFLSESLLICFAAALLALVIAELFREPLFHLTGREDVLLSYWNATTLGGIFAIAAITGLITGSYPAFFLSSFKPARLIKGAETSGRSSFRLRHGLVILQFSVAIMLLISVYIVSEQLSFAMEQDLGFDRENIMVIDTLPRQFDKEGLERMETLKTQMRELPGVVSASISWRLPIRSGTGGSTMQIRDPSWYEEQFITLDYLIVDHTFAKTYSLNLISGRFFSPDRPSDIEGLILNRSAVQALGWEDAEGKLVVLEDQKSVPVIGVIDDFYTFGMHNTIRPLVLISVQATNRYRMLSLRLAPQDVQRTIGEVEQTWHDVLPTAPFEYTFLDERISQLYITEQRTQKALSIAATLALGIACLGMLGLVAFTTQQRTKEIGIRKVLGATIASIVGLLSKDFLKLVMIGFIIAAPVAWYTMNQWLQNFAYRIKIGADVFVLAGGAAFFITLLTVSWQSIRAALANPVEILRNE